MQRSYFSAIWALFGALFLFCPETQGQFRRTYQASFFADIIPEGYSLIKVKKAGIDPKLGQGLILLEQLSGPKIRSKKIGVSQFLMAPACDGSRGELAPFRMINDTAYVLVKSLGKGKLGLPAPDNGIMYASAGWVAWGFLHPALPIYVSERLFRSTFLSGWNALTCSKSGLPEWAEAQRLLGQQLLPLLQKPPAPMGGTLDTLHFQQSYALEWVALLQIPITKELLYPFWESQHDKHRLSAIKAAAGLPPEQAAAFWIDGLLDPNWKPYEQLLALQGLIQLKAPLPSPESLSRIRAALSHNPTRLPLLVDDPRFCSSYPSLQSLVEKWVQLHPH